MSDTPRHSVACVGIVVDDTGRVLVIQRRDTGEWQPPGGVLELDEGPEEGTVREVREETGVDVEVECLTGVYKNLARGIVTLAFLCRPVAGAPQPSSESSHVEWVQPNIAVRRMAKAHGVRITDATHGAAGCRPAIRKHDGSRLM